MSDSQGDLPTTDRGFVIGSDKPEGAPIPEDAGEDFATPDPSIQPAEIETDAALDQDPI